MATHTPIFGWTIPVDNDDISSAPTDIGQGFKDVENSFHVTTDSLAASALSTSYPLGMSLMTLTGTGATSGAWPQNVSSLVFTLRRTGAEAALQYWFATLGAGSHPTIMARSAAGGSWTPWTLVAGSGQPWATASGTKTFSNINAPTSATIAFPSGRFTAQPNVTATTHDRNAVLAVTAISSTGFTLLIGVNGSGSLALQDYNGEWIAIQSY
jgi:hypothetical protein